MDLLSLNRVSGVIIEVAIDIHRKLGPGLLESVYQQVLAYELRKRRLRVECEVPIPAVWDGQRMEVGFRADLIVEDEIIVELKSIEAIQPVHKKILLTYLRLADKHLGLLLNFGRDVLKDGICRIANGDLI